MREGGEREKEEKERERERGDLVKNDVRDAEQEVLEDALQAATNGGINYEYD